MSAHTSTVFVVSSGALGVSFVCSTLKSLFREIRKAGLSTGSMLIRTDKNLYHDAGYSESNLQAQLRGEGYRVAEWTQPDGLRIRVEKFPVR